MTKTICRWVLLIVLWCVALPEATACRCAFLDALNEKAIAATAYIAHVRIKSILPGSGGNDPYFRIAFEELAHFKGNQLSEIRVRGGHPSFNTWTSCDLDMHPGQEWILFAQLNDGVPIVGSCWYSQLYRSATGTRDWQFRRGLKELDWLQRYYNKPEQQQPDGVDTSFYSNGNIERVVRYRNGQPHGTERIYFEDGQLNGRSSYRKGRLHGRQQWYGSNGLLNTSGRYRKGHRIGTFRIYDIGQSPNLPTAIHRYNHRGRHLRSRYYRTTPRYHLGEERVYYRHKRSRYVYYHVNGRPSEKGNSKDYHAVGTTLAFDEHGKIIKRWRYAADGKLLSFEQF